MSRTICSKSAVARGWKTIAALPVLFRPSVISSVTCAVVIANTRSVGTGFLIARLPRRTSKRPMGDRLGGALELRLEALESGDAPLEGGVRGEQAAEPLPDARREDVDGLQVP